MQTLFDVPAFDATQASPRVGGKYRFYSTKELVKPLLDDHWEITQAFQIRPRNAKYQPNPYAKHLVRLTHPKLQLGEDRLEAIIRNSHDGRSRFEFMLGAWRCVCSNGIFIGDAYATVSILHTRAFEAVQEQAQALIEHAPEVSAQFDAWKGRELNTSERLFLGNAARKLRWGDLTKAPVSVDRMLDIRRPEDQGNDLWSVFNRVQENLLTGGMTRLNDRRRVRAIRAIDETVRLNRELWKAASGLYGGNSDLALPS